jgi:phosphoadenosine phosphosulfate reductase
MGEGFTIWLTGLSGAGKSTLARALGAALTARGRRLEVLDGDVVREHLSQGLGFSKADRDTNIRRIAFVADLLTRHGAVAIVAAISPYRAARDAARQQIRAFVEVHVRCPLETLVRRDVKGLYARALRGEVAHFTGVSDPYEEPLAPEVVVDTEAEDVDESVAKVLSTLEGLGYLGPEGIEGSPDTGLGSVRAGRTKQRAYTGRGENHPPGGGPPGRSEQRPHTMGIPDEAGAAPDKRRPEYRADETGAAPARSRPEGRTREPDGGSGLQAGSRAQQPGPAIAEAGAARGLAPEAVARAARDLAEAEPQKVVHWALGAFRRERLAVCTSFQVDGMAILDMAWRIDPRVRVFTIDTGRLPAETYAVIEAVRARYGIAVEVYLPDHDEVAALVSTDGPNLFYRSVPLRLRCCEVRKVQPTRRVLRSLDAWITGLRRDQYTTRAAVEAVEVDAAHGGIVKINPLARWTEAQVWDYMRAHDVPSHALYAQGYTSIGCAPCTRPVAPGESARAGRWWWETDAPKECGMHCAVELVAATPGQDGAEPQIPG